MPARYVCEFRTATTEETISLGRELGAVLGGGEVIALEGDLGSGKTTFTRGLCVGLGAGDSTVVSSPTYVLEHVYPARVPVHHYDVYRLDSAEELFHLGFLDNLADDRVVVLEWADKVSSALPVECLGVELQWRPGAADPGSSSCLVPQGRRIMFSGLADIWEERIRAVEDSCKALKFPLVPGDKG
jgi:tRNA threonylcarbamoyladenosine biosynthesis protein TsaE